MVRRFGQWLIAAVAAGVALLHSETAFAGCFTTCNIKLTSVGVEPELGCLFVDPMESECICGVSVTIQNGCSTNVDLVTGELEGCGPPRTPQEEYCSTLAPGNAGTKSLGVKGDGFRRWVIPVMSGGVEHRVMIEASVTNYDNDSCGCPGTVGAAPRDRKPGRLALATFPLWFLVWRRKARKAASS